MTHPQLSIIIITLNEQSRLPLLLHDLAGQSWSDFEIIHVDSQSDDRTVEVSKMWASRFNGYRIIQMGARGVSKGRNTGATAARSERLLFLDADTHLDPTFLEKSMSEISERSCDLGIVPMSADGLPLRYRLGYASFNAGIWLTSFFFPTAIGACLFSTRSLHRDVSGFDQSISLCEDCNYALKVFRRREYRLSVLKTRFGFDPRRLEQDGFASTGFLYLKANLRRFLFGELTKQEIPYAFGHYSEG
ncbi:MAG: glycosyltransferase [Pseudomonadota bacterium]